jgi:hypothetical protein
MLHVSHTEEGTTMSYQPPPQPGYQMPPPPRPRRHRGRTAAIFLGAVVAVFIAIVVIGAALTAKPEHRAAPSPAVSAAPAATTTTPAAPATPNPDGTYTGSCDYTLTDNISSSNAGTLIGEIDLRNTGNVGTVDHVRITWPQEGFAPVASARVVRVPAGQGKTVRFHVTASQNVISELQSWQDNHNFRDGCTYKASITSTFGEPQS